MNTWTLHEGDCRDVLPTLAAGSVDSVISDPPYAEIDRPYGRLTEPAWHELMDFVVEQSFRVLKPRGSMVFVVQPNFEKLGRMRPWVFEFMAKAARTWGMVQDAYWWNFTTLPGAGCERINGLLRSSIKPCVWIGARDCYRDQESVLVTPRLAAVTAGRRGAVERFSSGRSVDYARIDNAAAERGGATPSNLLPISNARGHTSAGSEGHGAGTPAQLCSWWVRYICPPGGTVLDPFAGTSTVGQEALKNGRSFVGIERMPEYCEASRRRLEAASAQPSLFGRAVAAESLDV